MATITITITPASTITISLTHTSHSWGEEWTVACDGCTYYRHYGSHRRAENDQLTHEC